MRPNPHASRLFGALVLGGSTLLSGCATRDVETIPPELAERPGPEQAEGSDDPHCQLEFAFHEYDRDGVRVGSERTCLDDQSDEAILSVIRQARDQACQSPFCGCWLG